jgi:hypothetical protein
MIDNPPFPTPQPNGDEAQAFGPKGQFRHIGNFHKTLPHNEFGEVDLQAYEDFRRIAEGTHPQHGGDFEFVAPTPHSPPTEATLVNPQAGRADERLGPVPAKLNMLPPPEVLSHSTAAEMTELYWMALHRDVSLELLAKGMNAAEVLADLGQAFRSALTQDTERGKLQLGLDLPAAGGQLDLQQQTLYRCGLPAENFGPIVSQFFLHDVKFGTQTIVQKQWPYASSRDYLTDHASWLRAQRTGFDQFGKPYSGDNDYNDDPGFYEPTPLGAHAPPLRRIRTMRDLARFVNKDALHQAYFNAALLLLDWKAPVDDGNPYKAHYKRQGAFGTLGDPNLLALVSEVATRALKAVWRQKWQVNRRLRPEAYAGLVQMQALGHDDGTGLQTRPYGLPDWVSQTVAAQTVRNKHGALYLPMAFSAGSPAHPAYGAGHATVAGACVTVLKAWFKEDEPVAPLIKASRHPQTRAPLDVLQPMVTNASELPAYARPDAAQMTVEGELNKLASNVAMGRTMGGVHWRSDNTRSLRLGERVATVILKREIAEYAENPVSLTYRSFDGLEVKIDKQKVSVPGDPKLEQFYNMF